jgi:thioredoxin reductase
MPIIKLNVQLAYRFIVFRALTSVSRRAGLIEEKRRRDNRAAFDVAIIGSGYAGLACALVLGRHLVRTIIFDGGSTRNASTKRIHGYLGYENRSPKDLLRSAWSSVRQYRSVTAIKGRVTGLCQSADGSRFAVRLGRRIFRVKYVLIATGVLDVKPEIDGFDKFDGDGAWHCPYCDGHEAAGKRLAILVSGDRALSYVKEFFGWTKDITVFPWNLSISARDREQAKALGIRIVDDKINRITGRAGCGPKRLFGMADVYDASVIFYRLGYLPQIDLAKQVGCSLAKGYVKVDRNQRTSIPGVYAAGDIDTDRHLVAMAVAAGSRAGVDIYESLLSEAVRAKIKGHKSG